MFSIFQQHVFMPSRTLESVPKFADASPAPVTTSSLVALGADLKAFLEQPDKASIGDFAALVERLRGEFQMICGDAALTSTHHDSIAALFADAQTREFSQSDIGQIEAVLRGLD